MGVHAGENPVTQPAAMFRLKVGESLPPWGGLFLPTDLIGQNKKPEGIVLFCFFINKEVLTVSRQCGVGKSLVKTCFNVKRYLFSLEGEISCSQNVNEQKRVRISQTEGSQ